MPMASSGTPGMRKNAATCSMVSCGPPVSIRFSATISPGSVASAQRNLVPPASIAPSSGSPMPPILLDRPILCAIHYVRTSMNELFENLRLELRRGCLILAVLAALKSEQYGYTLRKSLTDSGMDIDEGTLYPLLRRLESQGLLSSQWREQDKRNKRFYKLSKEGSAMLKVLLVEWDGINDSLNGILEDKHR